MRDIKFLDNFGAYASCELTTGDVYFDIPEGKKWFFEKYAPIRSGFFKFLFYALQHEELHLTLYKLGEDDDKLHSEISRRTQHIALGMDYPEKDVSMDKPRYKKTLRKAISPSCTKGEVK